MATRSRRRLAVALSAGVLAVAIGVWASRRTGLESGREVRIEFTADGALRVRSPGRGWLELGRLDRSDAAGSETTLDALRRALREATRDATARDPNDGTWTRPFDVRGADEAPWYLAQWVAQVAVDPRVKVGTIRLWLGGQVAAVWDVPRDGSDFGRRQGRVEFVRVVLRGPRPGTGAPTVDRVRVAIGSLTEPVPEPDSEEEPSEVESIEASAEFADVSHLRPWLSAHANQVRGRVGFVETPLPAGSLARYADVVGAWRDLVQAGVHDVQLEGAPRPLPRSR